MGRSLALNFERNGYSIAGYDRYLKFGPFQCKEKSIRIFDSPHGLAAELNRPRIGLIVVPAGKSVDEAILSIKSFLEKGDIHLDGGNSFFVDTERRIKNLEEDGIYFIGMGVSGGEDGALGGPCLMPGGDMPAWPLVRPLLESIAAY